MKKTKSVIKRRRLKKRKGRREKKVIRDLTQNEHQKGQREKGVTQKSFNQSAVIKQREKPKRNYTSLLLNKLYSYS